MFELMQSVLLVFIEIMCCNIFYETFGKARYKGWINAIQFILLLCSTYILVYVFSKHFLIRQIAVILNFSVFMLWHVKISMKKSFVLAILFDALLLAMDSLAFLIMSWLSLDMKMSEQQHAIASVLGYLLVKVILFFLILVIRPSPSTQIAPSSQASSQSLRLRDAASQTNGLYQWTARHTPRRMDHRWSPWRKWVRSWVRT